VSENGGEAQGGSAQPEEAAAAGATSGTAGNGVADASTEKGHGPSEGAWDPRSLIHVLENLDVNKKSSLDVKAMASLVALSGVLLPVIGVVIRYVAFWCDGSLTAVRGPAAVAQPVSALAELGFLAMLAPLAIFIAVFLFDYCILYNKRKIGVAILVLVLALSIVIVSLKLPYKQALVALSILGVALYLTLVMLLWFQIGVARRRLRAKEERAKSVGSGQRANLEKNPDAIQLGFGRITLIACPALLASIALGGLFFVRLPAGEITFSNDSGVQHGTYAIVGSSSDQTYLLPCQPNQPLTVISDSAMSSAQLFPTSQTRSSLFGVSTDCPASPAAIAMLDGESVGARLFSQNELSGAIHLSAPVTWVCSVTWIVGLGPNANGSVQSDMLSLVPSQEPGENERLWLVGCVKGLNAANYSAEHPGA
jgi:hypothetical protein